MMENLAESFEQYRTLFPSIMLFIGNLLAGLAIFLLGMFVGRWAKSGFRRRL